MDHSAHSGHEHHLLDLTVLATADPLAFAGFIAIFSFSFLASLHCGVMCGPLVCAQLGPETSIRNPPLWLYNLGRGVSYPLAGAAVAALGGGAIGIASTWGRVFSLMLGVALVAAAVLTFLGKSEALTSAVSRFAQGLLRPVLLRLRGASHSARMFVLGLLTVFLPCMTLTPALLLAAASGSPVHGAATLLAFYMGTVPIMVTAPLVPAAAARRFSRPGLRWMSGIFLLIGGIITIFRLFH